ncbi:hypothetical protein MNBD_GAMMA11-1459 [hydrothermal vent metagenome]|uniref:Uncharacterized protein n=1 Tax=hydrothermal vent metagenome TaxID=652676 RepID=A0A3B0WPL5_9ZZZZ
MHENLQTVLQKVASKILSPLVRVMLRNGIACGSFEEMVRKAYVDEAFVMARQQGKATISGVSAQTGLSRKEVKRLHELEQTEDNNSQKYNRAIRVISGWMNDSRFISSQGVSRPLDMEGKDQSFSQLVKDYSGDIPTRAMFNLLQKSGCVEQIDGKVYLTSHAYVPGNDPTDVINILGVDCNELMNTIIFNMGSTDEDRRFQRKVSTSLLAREHKKAFLKYAGRRSQNLLEELDSWLTEHEGDKENSEYISLGIYIHQGDTPEETPK